MGVSLPRNACVFCGSIGSLTNEHAFPKWMRTLFPPGETEYHVVFGPTGQPREKREFTGPFADQKVKVVCGKCNHGWMERLERTLRPTLTSMIQGQHVWLTTQDQATLATWCVKTVMMLDHISPLPKIPTSQPSDLFKNQRPSDDFQVWLIGNATGRPRFHYAGQSVYYVLPADDGSVVGVYAQGFGLASGCYGYGYTFNIGHVTAQVFWSESSRIRQSANRSSVSGVLDRIWPIDVNSILFPTARWDEVSDYRVLCRRFFPQATDDIAI